MKITTVNKYVDINIDTGDDYQHRGGGGCCGDYDRFFLYTVVLLYIFDLSSYLMIILLYPDTSPFLQYLCNCFDNYRPTFNWCALLPEPPYALDVLHGKNASSLLCSMVTPRIFGMLYSNY